MIFSLLLACDPVTLPTDDTDDTDVSVDDTTDTVDTQEETGEPLVYDCSALPELPVQATLIDGFTGAEDFAFDGEGYLVSVDQHGNLVRINLDGDKELLVPGFGVTAGTHYLSTGELIIADVDRGRLIKVLLDGSSETLLSGLAYPNGVTVDDQDVVYVAEHDAGQVRSIPAEGGQDTIIATGLVNPNGLAFSTDWQTLFVGSFGGGTVHAISREGDGWQAPELFAEVETVVVDPCVSLSDGTSCFIPTGGLGLCDAATCEADRDRVACEGLTEGDLCQTERLEQPVESLCAVDEEGLFCPRLEKQRVAVCVGKEQWDSCKVAQSWGYCVDTWEGIPACLSDEEQWDALRSPCEDLLVGDYCVSNMPTGPYEGECADYSDWGYGVICEYPFLWGDGGGLDGLGVDACDNVYVTEYVFGKVWRFDPDGSNQQLAADTGSFWIPNVHWGSGYGGWRKDVMYVMDRESFGVFALDLGVPGAPTAYQP